MVECSDLLIGMGVLKDRHAVAVADGGRDGEVRFVGEIGSDGGSVRRFVRKLERPGVQLRFFRPLDRARSRVKHSPRPIQAFQLPPHHLHAFKHRRRRSPCRAVP